MGDYSGQQANCPAWLSRLPTARDNWDRSSIGQHWTLRTFIRCGPVSGHPVGPPRLRMPTNAVLRVLSLAGTLCCYTCAIWASDSRVWFGCDAPTSLSRIGGERKLHLKASREKVKQLMARPLGELQICAVLIDGTPFQGPAEDRSPWYWLRWTQNRVGPARRCDGKYGRCEWLAE